jgi:hypothetical protein
MCSHQVVMRIVKCAVISALASKLKVIEGKDFIGNGNLQ